MKLQLILGNQLFSPSLSLQHLNKGDFIFMREDAELCTHFRYHKHKIIFFLAAMRSYRDELQDLGYQVHYQELSSKNKDRFEKALGDFVHKKKINEIVFYEIEDKFFEKRILQFCEQNKLKMTVLESPLFLTSRSVFRSYLGKTKKPFMKTFYEGQRKRMKILLDKDGGPMGGQWSFDEENRKALPKSYVETPVMEFSKSSVVEEVSNLVQKAFPNHPGAVENFWLPVTRGEAQEWLQDFLKNRFEEFGVYEDALSEKFDIINHSVLTPFLNTGLLTPQEVVQETLKFAKKKKIPMNSLEGFIRQVIGWREFVRGIYQNFSEKQDSSNFWNHQRGLTSHWYEGNTGIPPLDRVIKKTVKLGYAHHIERLMVIGSLMLLLEVHPKEAHRWFMEMFIDSSDWVMGPNVYGMALFSDGGIFATKPYFCGSNYYKKMGGYKDGDWQDGVDGLYWGFIEKNKAFFLKNPRMSMMVRTVEKMPADKKDRIYKAAEVLKARLTAASVEEKA